MDAQEFESLLLSEFEKNDAWLEWGDLKDYSLPKIDSMIELPPAEPQLIKLSVVDSNEHHEGNWKTDLYVILRAVFPDGTVKHYRKTGYYQSHDGEYWDGALVEVSPRIETVTVWKDPSEYDSYDVNSYG